MSAADGERLRMAFAAYDRGDLQGAKPVLLEFARRFPANAQVQAAAGLTLAELGDVRGCLPYLVRAHALAPREKEVSVNLAVAYLKLQQAANAVPLLRVAAQAGAADAAVQTLLAQAELQTGEARSAAASFQLAAATMRAQGAAPDADFVHDWAVALLQSGAAREAAGMLAGVPAVESNASLLGVLAEAEEKSGLYEKAVQHWKRAAELDPSEANLYAYGDELLQHWTFSAAAEILRFGSERFPASERMHMALGIAYYGNNQYDQAAAVFEAVLKQWPDSAAAADLLGRSCGAITSGQQAGCDMLRPFAEAHPANAPAALYAAVAILHQPKDQQDASAADALLHRALRADPKLADAWYQLGVLQQAQGAWQESAASMTEAIRLRPAFAEAHYRLSRAYAHLGQREEAQKEMEQQQRYAAEAKELDNKRLREVMTFLTSAP